MTAELDKLDALCATEIMGWKLYWDGYHKDVSGNNYTPVDDSKWQPTRLLPFHLEV